MTRESRLQGDWRDDAPASAESVWDYPRPPRVEPARARVRVVLGGVTIADTGAALRVLETSHPPVYYLPTRALRDVGITPSARTSFCEYKGSATYHTLCAGGRTEADAAWSYPQPSPGYTALTGHLAVYPSRMDACWVGDEIVRPQAGDFYGGWITSGIVGPF
ncbi:MAG: DUF427 domain-containing protein [Euzebyales bacterium]|nr:DUF427 domain-containing protein [Euzebyales bacterium]